MQEASSLFSIGQEKYLDHHAPDGHNIYIKTFSISVQSYYLRLLHIIEKSSI